MTTLEFLRLEDDTPLFTVEVTSSMMDFLQKAAEAEGIPVEDFILEVLRKKLPEN